MRTNEEKNKYVADELQGTPQRFRWLDLGEAWRCVSDYGNTVYIITDDDIEALKNGKILADIDEYGTLIGYKRRESEQ